MYKPFFVDNTYIGYGELNKSDVKNGQETSQMSEAFCLLHIILEKWTSVGLK